MQDPMQSAITAIYDTVNDPRSWEKTLDLCCTYVGARSSSVMVYEHLPDIHMRLSFLSQVFRDMGEGFLQHYSVNLIHHERDGWEFVMRQPVHTLVTDKDVWQDSDEIMVQREDFAYLLKHGGVLRRVVARLNDNRAWSDNVAFQFESSIKSVPELSRSRISLLLPHFAKSVEMGRAFHELKAQYHAVLSALDYIEVGVCIALSTGEIIVSNEEASRIVENRDGLLLSSSSHLSATESTDLNGLLREAIESVSASASGRNASTERLFSINRRSDKHPYLVEVSPLKDSLSEIQTHLCGAVITIVDPEVASAVNTSALAQVYGLTPAESQICKLLVTGQSSRKIAELRDVSPNTVKTQIASILSKTGEINRAGVIRLALRITPPVRQVCD